MLEKTAASLEPCGTLQRVLPGAQKPVRSTRQLHTAFWQNAAADIAAPVAWKPLRLPYHVDTGDRGAALTAAAFPLDFLYPPGALSLLRRLPPSLPDRPDSRRYWSPFASFATRLFASSAPHARPQVSEHTSHAGAVRNHGRPVWAPKEINILAATAPGSLVDDGTVHKVVHSRSNRNSINSSGFSANANKVGHGVGVEGTNHVRALNTVLAWKNPDDADDLWHHYQQLDKQAKNRFLRPVLVFLSRTDRLSDYEKISELFHKLDPLVWDGPTFVRGVEAEINLQNLPEALNLFARGLRHDNLDNSYLVHALDLLLTSALKSPSMGALKDIWRHYPEMAGKWDFDAIAPQLTNVARVPGLAQRTLDLRRQPTQTLYDAVSTEDCQVAVQTLERIMVRRAVVSCAAEEAIPLLTMTNDPLAFEDFLQEIVRSGREKVAAEVYNIYRKLPNARPSHPVLHEMFKVYKHMHVPRSLKLASMELLWKDWHRFETAPSRRAYQRYLAFFAKQGDKKRVSELWTEFMKLFNNDGKLTAMEGDDTYSHLLQVHAVLGEAEDAQRIFDDMGTKLGLEPTIYHWNILLNAYVKADDYDGAISTFGSIIATGCADRYSYGTLMRIVGKRGDLGFTVELYRQARKRGILASTDMLSSLIDAYCLNGYYQEAEDVCVRAADRGIIFTHMWNKLLYYNARRRDLASINALLSVMVQQQIPYDVGTYKQLLIALGLCRQSQQALRLLTLALKENLFPVTTEHFEIVLGSLLTTGESDAALRLHRLMADYGFPRSDSKIMFRLTQTLAQWKNMSPVQRNRHSATEWLGKVLRSFYGIYGLRPHEKPVTTLPSSANTLPSSVNTLPPSKPRPRTSGLLRSGPEVYRFRSMIYMFTQLKDFARARDLVDLYRFVTADTSDSDGDLPARMLSSLMEASFHEKDYDSVTRTWQLFYDTAKTEARSADYRGRQAGSPKISAKYRWILSDGLRVMQELFFTKSDPSGLQELVADVLAEGFEVDSKNWNYYVQVLIQLKRYKEAFTTCERRLMPNWHGWQTVRAKDPNLRARLPLGLRRKGASRQYLRPTALTLHHCAQGYLELDRLSIYSSDAERTMRQIKTECVQVVRAIKTMMRQKEISGPSEGLDAIGAEEMDAVDSKANYAASVASDSVSS
ncbi:hypothetical protein GGR56DRAFT_632448 [Xylariaceae sp. FL0804]|nr:hypothetical protein GGR56DRAFT_632448 [Xylariaceae sp. FL0804]